MIATITNENEVKKALVEVKAIIERLSNEYYQKIPNNIKSYIEESKDKDYIWVYNEEKELQEQSLNEYTLAILAYINTEYLLNDEQKELMNSLYEKNDKKIENELREKYNPDEIFKKKEQQEIQSESIEENSNSTYQMVEYKENIFNKILNFIKGIFNRK